VCQPGDRVDRGEIRVKRADVADERLGIGRTRRVEHRLDAFAQRRDVGGFEGTTDHDDALTPFQPS
jgi:hypothetical protein